MVSCTSLTMLRNSREGLTCWSFGKWDVLVTLEIQNFGTGRDLTLTIQLRPYTDEKRNSPERGSELWERLTLCWAGRLTGPVVQPN